MVSAPIIHESGYNNAISSALRLASSLTYSTGSFIDTILSSILDGQILILIPSCSRSCLLLGDLDARIIVFLFIGSP